MVRNSKNSLAKLALLAGLTLLVGCKSSEECDSNADCPDKQFCNEKGACDFECRTDSDCLGGNCNSLGKCVGGKPVDAGPRDASGDLGDLGAGPDASPDLYSSDLGDMGDTGAPDSYPWDKGGGDLPDNGATDMGAGTVWVPITAGNFYMGAPAGELCRDSKNESYHHVTLSKKFEISRTEVTRLEFYKLMNYSPSKVAGCTAACPVEFVTWHEAVAYCNALTKAKGGTACYTCSGSGATISCDLASAYKSAGAIYSCTGYRLPSDAEWEYAARSGSTSSLYNGALASCTSSDTLASAIAWYDKNSSTKSHPVMSKTANAWGLYDMAGNVMEWTNDWYQDDLGTISATNPTGPTTGTQRVTRGGAWNQAASYLRSAARQKALPSGKGAFLGFRCVRTKP